MVVTETGGVPAIPVNAENIGSMTALISNGFRNADQGAEKIKEYGRDNL